MKNLKKVLSLVLALAMALSLMTTAFAADASDFKDYDKVTYEEAVDVMVAIGVFNGVENNNFDPNGTLTREQAAKIITYMLLGQTQADKLVATIAPYSDVAATRWSAGSIAYCTNEGILAGTGGNKFNPTGKLTGLEFAKMLLVALGYDASIEQLTGSTWAINTATMAYDIGLDDGLENVSLSKVLTREQAAQMAFNAEKTPLVKYDSKGTEISVNGAQINFGASAAEYVTTTIAKEQTISDTTLSNTNQNVFTIEFGEKYCRDLKVGTAAADKVDGMARPAHTWYYKNDKIGRYADEADYTFVVSKAKTAAKLIDDELGSSTVDTGSILYINGKNAQATTANDLKVGDVVEIFMDDSKTNTVKTVAVTRYSAGQLTGDVATKGTGDDTKIRVPGVISYTAADDVIGADGLVEDDVVYYYQDNEGVYHFAKADSIEGKLSTVNAKNPLSYVVDGTTYVVNENCKANGLDQTAVVFNTTYRFYLDNNGYAVYGEEVEDTLSDYVVIQEAKYVGVDDNSHLGDSDCIEARLVKMDGTTEIVKIASIKMIPNGQTAVFTYSGVDTSKAFNAVNGSGNNRYLAVDKANNSGYTTSNVNAAILRDAVDKTFFTYKINSDGEYELTYVNGNGIITTAPASTVSIEAGKVKDGPTSTIPVNDNTVFVVAKKTHDSKFNVFTGKNNVPDLTGATISYVKKNGMVTYMYIDSYTASTFSGNSVFFMKGEPESYTEVKKDDGSVYGYNTYKAIVNDEATTVKVAANAPGIGVKPATVYNTLKSGAVAIGLFNPEYNDDGVIISLTANANVDAMAYGYKLEGTTLVTGKVGSAYTTAYVCNNDVPVYIMDDDEDVNDGSASDLDKDGNDQIYVVKTNASDNEAKFIFIVEKDDDETGIVVTASDNSVATAPSYVDTVLGETVIHYTVKAGSNVTITPVAGCTITTDNTSPYWDSMGSTLTFSSVSAGDWIAVKVVAEDTTVAYYGIEVIA